MKTTTIWGDEVSPTVISSMARAATGTTQDVLLVLTEGIDLYNCAQTGAVAKTLHCSSATDAQHLPCVLTEFRSSRTTASPSSASARTPRSAAPLPDGMTASSFPSRLDMVYHENGGNESFEVGVVGYGGGVMSTLKANSDPNMSHIFMLFKEA